MQAQTSDSIPPPTYFTTRDLGNRDIFTTRQQSQGMSSVVPLNMATPNTSQTPKSPYTYFVNWSLNRSMDPTCSQADCHPHNTSGTLADLQGRSVSAFTTKTAGWRAMEDLRARIKSAAGESHSDISLHEMLDESASSSQCKRAPGRESSGKDYLNFVIDPFQRPGQDQPNPCEQQLGAISTIGDEELILRGKTKVQEATEISPQSPVSSRAEQRQTSETMSTLEDINFALQLPYMESPGDGDIGGSAQSQSTEGACISPNREQTKAILSHQQKSLLSRTDSLSFNLQPPEANSVQPRPLDDPS